MIVVNYGLVLYTWALMALAGAESNRGGMSLAAERLFSAVDVYFFYFMGVMLYAKSQRALRPELYAVPEREVVDHEVYPAGSGVHPQEEAAIDRFLRKAVWVVAGIAILVIIVSAFIRAG